VKQLHTRSSKVQAYKSELKT